MTGEAEFDKQWLSENAGAVSNTTESAVPDIKAIKEYAYWAFDHLDRNGNGFLERDELLAVLNSHISAREKSFITFLLNNQQNIADMVHEEGAAADEGISRGDLESYFTLLTEMLG